MVAAHAGKLGQCRWLVTQASWDSEGADAAAFMASSETDRPPWSKRSG